MNVTERLQRAHSMQLQERARSMMAIQTKPTKRSLGDASISFLCLRRASQRIAYSSRLMASELLSLLLDCRPRSSRRRYLSRQAQFNLSVDLYILKLIYGSDLLDGEALCRLMFLAISAPLRGRSKKGTGQGQAGSRRHRRTRVFAVMPMTSGTRSLNLSEFGDGSCRSPAINTWAVDTSLRVTRAGRSTSVIPHIGWQSLGNSEAASAG